MPYTYDLVGGGVVEQLNDLGDVVLNINNPVRNQDILVVDANGVWRNDPRPTSIQNPIDIAGGNNPSYNYMHPRGFVFDSKHYWGSDAPLMYPIRFNAGAGITGWGMYIKNICDDTTWTGAVVQAYVYEQPDLNVNSYSLKADLGYATIEPAATGTTYNTVVTHDTSYLYLEANKYYYIGARLTMLDAVGDPVNADTGLFYQYPYIQSGPLGDGLSAGASGSDAGPSWIIEYNERASNMGAVFLQDIAVLPFGDELPAVATTAGSDIGAPLIWFKTVLD